MKRTNKKGISLIVLVITIIVMIILAAAIVITLSNSGVINKANEAVDTTNLKQVQELAQMIWAEGYLDGDSTEEIQEAIETQLGDAASLYDITVTDKGVEITAKGDGGVVTSEWVTTTVDGVPIPKGFVASPYATDQTTPNMIQGLKGIFARKPLISRGISLF